VISVINESMLTCVLYMSIFNLRIPLKIGRVKLE